MKITYDPDADAMYIYLRDVEVARTQKINDHTIVDFDKAGKLIGIELLFVKETNPELLKELKYTNIASA